MSNRCVRPSSPLHALDMNAFNYNKAIEPVTWIREGDLGESSCIIKGAFDKSS